MCRAQEQHAAGNLPASKRHEFSAGGTPCQGRRSSRTRGSVSTYLGIRSKTLCRARACEQLQSISALSSCGYGDLDNDASSSSCALLCLGTASFRCPHVLYLEHGWGVAQAEPSRGLPRLWIAVASSILLLSRLWIAVPCSRLERLMRRIGLVRDRNPGWSRHTSCRTHCGAFRVDS